MGHDRQESVGELGVGVAGPHPIDEQPYRRVLSGVGQVGVGLGQGQGWEGEHPFPTDGEGSAARHHEAALEFGGQDLVDHGRHLVEEMLGVVDHEEIGVGPESIGDPFQQRAMAVGISADQRVGDADGDIVGVAHRCQIDEGDGAGVGDRPADRQRQRGLADATGAEDGDQSVLADQRRCFLENAVAAEEGRAQPGELRGAAGAERRKARRQPVAGQRVALDRFGYVAQPVGAEGAKPETVGRDRVVGEVSGDAADQHLIAVGEVEEAGRTVHGRAPHIIVESHHLTGVQRHPHPQLRFELATLALRGRPDRTARRAEHGQHTVAGRLDDDAVGCRDRRGPDLVHLLDLVGRVARSGLPPADRALDVAQQHGHRRLHRWAACCDRRFGVSLELRVVAEDLLLQLGQRRARLQPQFGAQVGSGPLERSQRVGLAAAPVQRQHQQLPATLAQRCFGDGGFEFRDGCRRVLLEAARQALFDEPGSCLLEADLFGREDVAEVEIAQCRSAPQRQCVVDLSGPSMRFHRRSIEFELVEYVAGRRGSKAAGV